MAKFIPGPPEVMREALIVVAGAILAAFIVGQIPSLKSWLREQWAP